LYQGRGKEERSGPDRSLWQERKKNNGFVSIEGEKGTHLYGHCAEGTRKIVALTPTGKRKKKDNHAGQRKGVAQRFPRNKELLRRRGFR